MIKGLAIPFGLAGASVGMGILGEQLGSTGLQQGGAAVGSFIAPAVTISAGGMVIGMLRDIDRGNRYGI